MARAYDPSLDAAILLGVGSAHTISEGPAEGLPEQLGPIWVPDPEQRRGWRERYVDALPKPGVERRPIGFRKPGAL